MLSPHQRKKTKGNTTKLSQLLPRSLVDAFPHVLDDILVDLEAFRTDNAAFAASGAFIDTLGKSNRKPSQFISGVQLETCYDAHKRWSGIIGIALFYRAPRKTGKALDAVL